MPRLPQTTLQLPRARRLLAIVGATVLALVVATFADMRTAGDVPDDIEVAVATSTSTAGSAGGGSGEPGPGAGDVAPTSSPPLPTVNGVRFPDLVLLFQSALALSDGGEAMLTYRAGVTARDGGEYALAAQLFAQVSAGSGALAPFARLREAQMRLRRSAQWRRWMWGRSPTPPRKPSAPGSSGILVIRAGLTSPVRRC
jgi:hypothetical protein